MRIPYISLIASAAVALGGCGYNGLGVGVGYGSPYGAYGAYSPYGSYGSYGRYPYSGYGYGVDPFYYGSRYGYGMGYGTGYGGYGFPYFGWNNGFYYPGTGYYVYDRYRRPRLMTSQERTFWGEVLRRARQQAGGTATTAVVQPNWSGFSQPTRNTVRRTTTAVNRPTRTRSLERVRAQREERRAERRTRTTNSTTERRRNRRDSDDN